jgi:acyl carrier protein
VSDADIEERVRGVIADVFGLDATSIDEGTSTDTVEAWDSLQHLTVVLALEEEFGIQLTDEETVTAVNFPLITMIVREKLGITEPS